MTNWTDLTADQILAIKLPGDLFSSPEVMSDEYIDMALRWHPDKGGIDKVFAKITEMHVQGKKDIENGVWNAKNKKIFPLNAGKGRYGMAKTKKLAINFLTERPFEIGSMYVCNRSVAFAIAKDHAKLADNIDLIIPQFKFSSDKMKSDISKSLPKVIAKHEAKDGTLVIIVEKEPETYMLGDVLTYYGGKIPPKHVAWILSTMYNLCCYLNYSNITHNSLTLETYFISPATHAGHIVGGWWYATPKDEKLEYIPRKIDTILPASVRSNKMASILTDLESVKLIGRELLGDRNGTRLSLDKDIPAPMVRFLRDVSSSSPVAEYKAWEEVLKESFGPRRFVEMKIENLYDKVA